MVLRLPGLLPCCMGTECWPVRRLLGPMGCGGGCGGGRRRAGALSWLLSIMMRGGMLGLLSRWLLLLRRLLLGLR